MRLTYDLRIEAPDEIDPALLAEIEAEAAPHDTTLQAKVSRWIGGEISRAEEALSDVLPEGWYAAIDEDADE